MIEESIRTSVIVKVSFSFVLNKPALWPVICNDSGDCIFMLVNVINGRVVIGVCVLEENTC